MSAYYTMNPADLPALLTAWQSGSRVLCPCKEQDGTTRLESFVPEKGLCLDYTNLAMPPVDVLNGYQDVLFRWEGNERTYVAEPGAEAMAPTVIFGMRPCDVSALEYLDDFYLGEYRDINYSMRREAVTIVGMNCRTPGKSCFCAATGTGPLTSQSSFMGTLGATASRTFCNNASVGSTSAPRTTTSTVPWPRGCRSRIDTEVTPGTDSAQAM